MRIVALAASMTLVGSLSLGVLLDPTGPSLAAESKILEYDAQGRVKGIKRLKNKDDGKKSGSQKFNPETSFEDGELIVINPPRNFLGTIRLMGFSLIERVRLTELNLEVQRLRIPTGMKVPKARTLLRGRFPGLSIDANHVFDPSAGNSNKTVARMAIGWRKATPKCGAGVKLGMIDAGVDLNHPALKGQNIVFRSFHKRGRKPGPNVHGTAVAAMLVGKPEWGGLLPGAKLLAANMFEINESGRKVGNAVALLKGINWMAKEKVHVVNLSVAGADNKVLRRVFKSAQKKGLIMVAAAGNWGSGAKPAFPAAYKDVMAVTAFSQKKLVYSRANTGSYIDFAAPGVRIYTAAPGGGGRFQSGTSFATPYLSALIGLEIAHRGKKKSSALRRMFRKSATDMGAKGKDKVFGWGFVNLQPRCPG